MNKVDKAFAAFLSQRGNSCRWYRVRFNQLAAKLFDGVEFVTIGKTNDYIIITPQNFPTGSSVKVGVDSVGIPYISMNRMVNSNGFLNESLFDGTRYAVKRNKDGTRIYICLKEVVNGYRGRENRNA